MSSPWFYHHISAQYFSACLEFNFVWVKLSKMLYITFIKLYIFIYKIWVESSVFPQIVLILQSIHFYLTKNHVIITVKYLSLWILTILPIT